MKSLLIVFCVIGLIHSVHGDCVSCKGGTPDSSCDDVYYPSGSDSEVCNSIHWDLCSKYGGSYKVSCGDMFTAVSCTVTCGAGPITPSFVLISAVLAFAIKMMH